jgi:hypothetical protein
MARRQTYFRSLNSVAGAALIAVGLFLLFANLDAAAAPMTRDLGMSEEGSKTLAVFGLAALHALQAYTFNHAGLLSRLQQILISFWPVTLVLFGAFLLRNALTSRFLPYGTGAGSTSVRVRS